MVEDPPDVGKLAHDVAESCERLLRTLGAEKALKKSGEVFQAHIMAAHMATDESAADYLQAMRRYVQAFEALDEDGSPAARKYPPEGPRASR
jgi:hypothetical protein